MKRLFLLAIVLAAVAAVLGGFGVQVAKATETCSAHSFVPQWSNTGSLGTITPTVKDVSCSVSVHDATVCTDYTPMPIGHILSPTVTWTQYSCGTTIANQTVFTGPGVNCDGLSASYEGMTWRTRATVHGTSGGTVTVYSATDYTTSMPCAQPDTEKCSSSDGGVHFVCGTWYQPATSPEMPCDITCGGEDEFVTCSANASLTFTSWIYSTTNVAINCFATPGLVWYEAEWVGQLTRDGIPVAWDTGAGAVGFEGSAGTTRRAFDPGFTYKCNPNGVQRYHTFSLWGSLAVTTLTDNGTVVVQENSDIRRCV